MSVREKEHPELYQTIQEQNLLRQYDLLSNCVEIGLVKGIEAFDKYTLWALNYAAVANIAQFGGRYREQPIYVGNHIPPHFNEVPHQMDLMFSMVHENWTLDAVDHPTWMEWRLVLPSERIRVPTNHPIQFRATYSTLVPYIAFPLNPPNQEGPVACNDLILGPGCHPSAEVGINMFLQERQIQIVCRTSRIPYRPT
jgi:hypothetical protein